MAFIITIILLIIGITFLVKSNNSESSNVITNNINNNEYKGDYDSTRNEIIDSISKKIIPDVSIEVENLPIFLKNNEKIIWSSNHINMYKMKSKTHYEGGSNGFSIRICKGLTYRTSSYKGEPVTTNVFDLISSGSLVITNKCLYFISLEQVLNIEYNSIMSIIKNSENNCIVIQENDGRKKPIVIESNDYDFLYKVIFGLMSLYHN